MNHDRPLLGILLMLGFCIVAPVGDAVAKVLGGSVPLAQVVLIRFAVQAAVLIPLVWLSGRAWRASPYVMRRIFLRTVLHVLGIAAMFTALKYLPLADAVAIVFVMPFFMLILGKYVLHEEVGPRRIAACLVGFVGTLLIVQPSFANVGWPALLPVFVAANFSLFMLMCPLCFREAPISWSEFRVFAFTRTHTHTHTRKHAMATQQLAWGCFWHERRSCFRLFLRQPIPLSVVASPFSIGAHIHSLGSLQFRS